MQIHCSFKSAIRKSQAAVHLHKDKHLLRPSGVPSPLCILELSRQNHIDMAVKNTTIFM